MLKMIKYELLRSYRNYFTLFLVYLAVCVALPFTVDFELIANILILVFVILIIGLGFAIFISIVSDFWKSMFSRQGYLTLTLPLSTAELLLAKLISATIWIIITTLILIFGVFILIMLLTTVVDGVSFSQVFEELRSALSLIQVDTLNVILTLLTGLIGTLSSIIYLYLCMSIVHTKLVRNGRVIIAIAIYFIGSMLFNTLLSKLNLNTSFSIDVYSAETMWSSLNSEMTRVFLVSNVIDIVKSIALFVTTIYIIDNHIELDA